MTFCHVLPEEKFELKRLPQTMKLARKTLTCPSPGQDSASRTTSAGGSIPLSSTHCGPICGPTVHGSRYPARTAQDLPPRRETDADWTARRGAVPTVSQHELSNSSSGRVTSLSHSEWPRSRARLAGTRRCRLGREGGRAGGCDRVGRLPLTCRRGRVWRWLGRVPPRRAELKRKRGPSVRRW